MLSEDRELPEGFADALDGQRVGLALMIYADFPAEAARAWTGLGTLEYGGQDWQGVGDLLEVSEIEETTDGSSRGLTVTLGGLELTQYSPAELEGYQGRAAELYLAIVDHDTSTLVADPVRIYAGIMDSDVTVDSGDSISVSITIERRDSDLLRPRPLRYSHEDQQLLYPAAGDDGLEYAVATAVNNITWGVKT